MARVGTPLSKIYHSAVPLTNFENLEFSRAEMKFLARGEEDFVGFVAVVKSFISDTKKSTILHMKKENQRHTAAHNYRQ